VNHYKEKLNFAHHNIVNKQSNKKEYKRKENTSNMPLEELTLSEGRVVASYINRTKGLTIEREVIPVPVSLPRILSVNHRPTKPYRAAHDNQLQMIIESAPREANAYMRGIMLGTSQEEGPYWDNVPVIYFRIETMKEVIEAYEAQFKERVETEGLRLGVHAGEHDNKVSIEVRLYNVKGIELVEGVIDALKRTLGDKQEHKGCYVNVVHRTRQIRKQKQR